MSLYGFDLISATDGSGNQSYFSYDAVGSVTDITNGAGAVTDTYVYDVFGTIKTHTGTSTNYWLFTGEQADRATGDTGYYFLRARYYDPALGRFISRDPLLFDQRYAYAGNNPVLLVDPSGLCGWELSWGNVKDCAEVVVDKAGDVVEGAYDVVINCFIDPTADCSSRIAFFHIGTMSALTATVLLQACLISLASGPGAAVVCSVAGVGVAVLGVAAGVAYFWVVDPPS